jgi:isoquinoline 1-oxidoreductase alpha subunit
MTTFSLNGRAVSVQSPDDAPLLWVIRDELGLTGTKFGCGIGMCGACTVHVEGRATRSCITTVGAVAGAKVTTIEGLDPEGRHPLQTAWLELQVPQCGYCQSGQIMQAATLLKDYPNPTDEDINAVMAGSLCRCMTYLRIRKAIKLAAAKHLALHEAASLPCKESPPERNWRAAPETCSNRQSGTASIEAVK